MKNVKVVLYDVEEKSVVEHEAIPDGEIELHGNDAMFLEVLMKVDELALGNKFYTILSRRFSVDTEKLVIGVKQKNK